MTATTNANGEYSFTVPAGADVKITPQEFENYIFNPLNRTYSDIAANIDNADFSATQSSASSIISADNVTIYPNPTNYELTITNYDGNSVEICDITGKIVMNCQLSTANSINVSALSQGIYFLKAGNSVQKFVKN